MSFGPINISYQIDKLVNKSTHKNDVCQLLSTLLFIYNIVGK